MVKVQARSYSGEVDHLGKTEDPGVWLDHFENICYANGWDSDLAKMRNCCLYLVGEAETWYGINKSWIRTGEETWSNFRAAFEQRFRPVNFLDDWEERVQNPVQKEGESIRAYGERYGKLLGMTNEGSPGDGKCLKYWISGMIPNIRRELRIAQPKTFVEAGEMAMKVE